MRITVLNTGGTISSVGTPLAPMAAGDFASACQRLLEPALQATLPDLDIRFDTGLTFPGSESGGLDSTDLRPSDWCLMARTILQSYDDADAFVILHGTDSLDFTASALPFLLNVFAEDGLGMAVLSKPVILTGAQLPLFRMSPDGLTLNAGSDAFANLAGALASARLRLPEVALFFDGKLWRGNRALKVSTNRFGAFAAPHLPPLAEAGIGLWHGAAAPLPGPAAPTIALDDPRARESALAQLEAIEAGLAMAQVVQLPAYPADHRAPDALLARMIDAAVAEGASAIILEAYGEGNFPAGAGAIPAALGRAAGAGVLIVDCSRVIGGVVGAFHYAAGAWIAQTGAISGRDMTPVAAFAKSMILIAASAHHGWSPDVLKAQIQRDLAGESAPLDRLEAGAVLRPGQSLAAADGSLTLTNDPASGPVLRDGNGRVRWRAGGPGRLEMRERPVVIGHDGGCVWQAGHALGGGVLLLGAGSVPGLATVDPARRLPPIVLYQG
jgi:L-asparaginase